MAHMFLVSNGSLYNTCTLCIFSNAPLYALNVLPRFPLVLLGESDYDSVSRAFQV
jgi:hypothetical protein